MSFWRQPGFWLNVILVTVGDPTADVAKVIAAAKAASGA